MRKFVISFASYSKFFYVQFSLLPLQKYLEMNSHDIHKLTLEHVREYDSKGYSRNAKKTSILDGKCDN